MRRTTLKVIKLLVKGSSSVTLMFVAATSYNGFDKNPFTEGRDEKASACNISII